MLGLGCQEGPWEEGGLDPAAGSASRPALPGREQQLALLAGLGLAPEQEAYEASLP